MFCSNCGTKIEETDLFCPNCGARNNEAAPAPVTPEPANSEPVRPEPVGEEPGPEPPFFENEPVPEETEQVEQKRRSRLKPLLLGVGALVVVAALVFGIFKLIGGKKDENDLFRAASESADELTDYLSDLPNLRSILDNAERISEKEDVEGGISFRVANNGDPIQGSVNVKVDAEANRAAADVSVQVPNTDKSIEASFYLDEENLMLTSRSLLKEDEIIALPIKDLAKKWNDSALAELIGAEMPEGFTLQTEMNFADLEEIMASAYGEQWKSFEKSIKLVKYEGANPRFTDGTIKTVSWDRELLKPMYEQAKKDLEEMEEFVPFLQRRSGSVTPTMTLRGELEQLTEADYSKLIADFIILAFGEFDESEIDLQLRFDSKDVLTGLYGGVEDSWIDFRLDGEKNPWEWIRIRTGSSYTYNGETREEIDGGDVRIRIENKQLSIEAYEVDTGTENRTEQEELVGRLAYDDDTGRIQVFDGSGKDLMEDVSLTVKPDGNRILVHAGELEDGEEQISLDLNFGPLSGGVTKPTGEVKDLLEMTEQQLNGLMMRIGMKLQKLLPADAFE